MEEDSQLKVNNRDLEETRCNEIVSRDHVTILFHLGFHELNMSSDNEPGESGINPPVRRSSVAEKPIAQKVTPSRIDKPGLNSQPSVKGSLSPERAKSSAKQTVRCAQSSDRLAGYKIPKKSHVIGLDFADDTDSESRTDSYGRSEESDEDFEEDSVSLHLEDDADDEYDSPAVKSCSREEKSHDPASLQDGGFCMFDPVAIAKPKAHTLTKQQQAFVK